jgi:hypothetical protein
LLMPICAAACSLRPLVHVVSSLTKYTGLI